MEGDPEVSSVDGGATGKPMVAIAKIANEERDGERDRFRPTWAYR